MKGFLLALAVFLPAAARAQVKTGLDLLQENGFRELQGKRVGLITNQTGVDAKGRSAASILLGAPGVELAALFSPEHGFTGLLEADQIPSGGYRLPDGRVLPMYSLYGATKSPTPEMLSGLDALVFDIADIGARFYTYATTMGLAMEAAAAAGLGFVVLDRPNPIGGEVVEGAILDPEVKHFTAYFQVPTRHGLTMGEIARLHNLTGRVGARLSVVPVSGWRRGMWHDETGLPWVRPSPNMPDLDAAALYPGIGGFEATNLSVGRGTDIPFRWVGAPWLDARKLLKRLKKVRFDGLELGKKSFTPAKSVYEGKKCSGVRIRVRDRKALRPLRLFVHLICALRDLHPQDFEVRWEEMRRMAGTERFRELYLKGAPPEEILAVFEADSERFRGSRAPLLLY